VHNLPWIVQEVHNARLIVSLLSEDQPWYAEYMSLQHVKDVNDPDYWCAPVLSASVQVAIVYRSYL
jgi:hypothetical protein